jgi:integrase
MFKRTRYQDGCLKREGRKSSPDVWIFRWRETALNGRRVNRKVVVGTVAQYRTESAAQKAVDALRIDINKETPQAILQPVTVEQLVAHYKRGNCPRTARKRLFQRPVSIGAT